MKNVKDGTPEVTPYFRVFFGVPMSFLVSGTDPVADLASVPDAVLALAPKRGREGELKAEG